MNASTRFAKLIAGYLRNMGGDPLIVAYQVIVKKFGRLVLFAPVGHESQVQSLALSL